MYHMDMGVHSRFTIQILPIDHCPPKGPNQGHNLSGNKQDYTSDTNLPTLACFF